MLEERAHVTGERAGTLVPPVRIALERGCDDRLDVAAQRGVDRAERHGIVVGDDFPTRFIGDLVVQAAFFFDLCFLRSNTH